MNPREWLVEESRKSDIGADAPAYAEIDAMLRRHGLDVIFWRFESVSSSAWARATEDGGHETCPALKLYFRRERDYLAQEVDPHLGNWRDDWRLTEVVRSELNEILCRLSYNAQYVSPSTFIFLESWESVAFDLIGRAAKAELSQRISEILVPIQPVYVFWHSDRCYFVVFKDAVDCEAASRAREQLERAAEEIIASYDSENYCEAHRVEMRLKHLEMMGLDLYGMSRED